MAARTNLARVLTSLTARTPNSGSGTRCSDPLGTLHKFSGSYSSAAVAAEESEMTGSRYMGSERLGVKDYEDYRRSLYGEITHKAVLVDAVGTLVVPSQPMAEVGSLSISILLSPDMEMQWVQFLVPVWMHGRRGLVFLFNSNLCIYFSNLMPTPLSFSFTVDVLMFWILIAIEFILLLYCRYIERLGRSMECSIQRMKFYTDTEELMVSLGVNLGSGAYHFQFQFTKLIILFWFVVYNVYYAHIK